MNSKPKVSVIICTRNRGNLITLTLESVLANIYESFEVLVIDQSTNDETKSAIQSLLIDPRLIYIRTNTSGLSIARNIGLKEAKGEFLAYTDDDCTVPKNWVEKIYHTFQEHPRLAVLNCNVIPPSNYDKSSFIPGYQITNNRTLFSIKDCYQGIGIGAGMAVRRKTIISIGGFDEALGAGAKLSAGEDHDIVIRALIHGWQAFDLADTHVVHYGSRNIAETKILSKRNWYGLGATYIKPIKCFHWKAGIVFISRPVLRDLFKPYLNIFRFKKPRGALRLVYFLKGIISGCQLPVDRTQILYK